MDHSIGGQQQCFTHGKAIIHADVTSIEPETDDVPGKPSKPLDFHDHSHESEERKIAESMREWWGDSMRKNMNIQDNYAEVHVLMIKWARHIDQLKTEDEVNELTSVFESIFHYNVERLELDNTYRKPQHQLNTGISEFVSKHDRPNNLLIVYYTGHGSWIQAKHYLELSATNSKRLNGSFPIPARANFNMAEEMTLKADHVDADVLTILDTCFSSNMTKGPVDSERTYELFSATGFDQTTSSPGEDSFTRSLIDALKDLAAKYGPERSFTTYTLWEKINHNPIRHDTPCFLWNRLDDHERHIRLQPLPQITEVIESPHSGLREPIRGYLSLRFALRKETLDREQIEFLTQKFSQIFAKDSKVPVQRIDWMGIKKSSRHAFFAVQVINKWKRLVATKKRKLEAIVDEVDMVDADTSPRKKEKPFDRKHSTDMESVIAPTDPLTPNSLHAHE